MPRSPRVSRKPPLDEHQKKYGTRDHPREMLTAEAAISLCKESGWAMWVRLPMYAGKFHIWPGGRKEFWPDRKDATMMRTREDGTDD